MSQAPLNHSLHAAPGLGFQRDAAGRASLGGALIEPLLTEHGISTPAYLYDLDAIEKTTLSLVEALGDPRHVIAYAIKANSAGSIVKRVARAGAGADLVSGGELAVALACGIQNERIVMSGVAKSDAEIDQAIAANILAIQAESIEEIPRIAARAKAQGRSAPISLRVNPGIEIDAHAHIATGHDEAKFGILERELGRAFEVAKQSAPHITISGISTHVGSMLKEPSPYLESARTVCRVAKHYIAEGAPLSFVDFGGGFGIDYGEGAAQPPAEFARAAVQLLATEGLSHLKLVLEPGRAVVGPYGVLVARVIQIKRAGELCWVMIDAGMNDLIRPALYAAKHRIEPCNLPQGNNSPLAWRVVGPVCESSDDFGSHQLGAVPEGLVVIRDAGAYGYAMASEYNGRALPAEVFLSGGKLESYSPSPGVEHWVARRLKA